MIRFLVCMWVVSSDWWVLWKVVLVIVSGICVCSVEVKLMGFSLRRCWCDFVGVLLLMLIIGSLMFGLSRFVLFLLGWLIVIFVS